jgi:hypothetical protein
MRVDPGQGARRVAASLVVGVTYVNILPFVGWVGVVSIVLLRRREEKATAVVRGSEYDATPSPVTVTR